jgi:hypothetical protein
MATGGGRRTTQVSGTTPAGDGDGALHATHSVQEKKRMKSLYI